MPIKGFDQFINQVSISSRGLAYIYAYERLRAFKTSTRAERSRRILRKNLQAISIKY